MTTYGWNNEDVYDAEPRRVEINEEGECLLDDDTDIDFGDEGDVKRNRREDEEDDMAVNPCDFFIFLSKISVLLFKFLK